MRTPRTYMLDMERRLARRRWSKSGKEYVPKVEFEAVRLSENGFKPPQSWIDEGWPEG
jgi:hypothetical protein